MSDWIYLNGRVVPVGEARISVMDRGLLYGDGVFTTLRLKDGIAEAWDLHWERLTKQAQDLGIEAPLLNRDVFSEWIRQCDAQTGVWRMKWIVTGGTEPGLKWISGRQGALIGLLSPIASPVEKPMTVGTYPGPLVGPASHIKSLAYLERLQVLKWAQDAGYDEAVVLASNGTVLDLACAGLAWMDEDCFYVPDTFLPILRSVTLRVAIEAWKVRGGTVRSVAWRLDEIPATALWLSFNAIQGIRIIRGCEGEELPTDQGVTATLRGLWEDRVRDLYGFRLA